VLSENILKAIKEAISAVEIDIQERISNGESFEDLDLMKSELIEMQIEKIIEFSDLKIVLYYEFDCYPKVLKNYSRNIWAFDKQGNLKW